MLWCLEECCWDLLPLYGPDFPSFFHNSLPFIELTCHSHYNFFVQLVSKWNGSGCFSMIRKELSVFFVEFNFEWWKRPSFAHEETFQWKELLLLTLFFLFPGMFSYPSRTQKKENTGSRYVVMIGNSIKGKKSQIMGLGMETMGIWRHFSGFIVMRRPISDLLERAFL